MPEDQCSVCGGALSDASCDCGRPSGAVPPQAEGPTLIRPYIRSSAGASGGPQAPQAGADPAARGDADPAPPASRPARHRAASRRPGFRPAGPGSAARPGGRTSADAPDATPAPEPALLPLPPGGPEGRHRGAAPRRQRVKTLAATAGLVAFGTAGLVMSSLGRGGDRLAEAASPTWRIPVSVQDSPGTDTTGPRDDGRNDGRTDGRPPSAAAPATSPAPALARPSAPPAGTTAPDAGTATPRSAATPHHTPTPAPSGTQQVYDTLAAAPRVMRLGDSGADVADLQSRLTRAGAYHKDVTGVYDTATERAVAHFQHWYRIDGDPVGVYGFNTRVVLDRYYP